MRRRFSSAIGMGAALVLLGAVAVAPAEEPRAPGTPPPPTAEVDAILTRMEQRTVRDLHAKLVWDVQSQLDIDAGDNDKIDSKRGEIWYKTEEPVPKFMVRFVDRVNGRRRDKIDEQHLFDGNWYIERKAEPSRTVTRREVRKATDRGNPYKLGENCAFPVPFGQSKAEILREFTVLQEPAKPDDPKNTDHLILTPQPGSRMFQKYQRLDFWVQSSGPEAGLPVRVSIAKRDGTGRRDSIVTVSFTDAKLDRGMSEDVFKIETPRGYEEIVEPLEQQKP